MPNPFFRFKQFIIHQDRCAMKVTTDACLFGAWVAGELKIENEKLKVLDIGTGTGLLSLMIVQKNKACFTAVEIDENAYEQASGNISASPWQEDIQLIHGNIKDIVLADQYDIIVSNPPFYENEWQSGNTQKNTAHHDSGLLITELLPIIKTRLRPGGKFYLLLPFKRDKELMRLLAEENMGITRKILVRQSEDHGCFRVMIEGQPEPAPKTTTGEISIRNKGQAYTKEFTDLLKDYYLYL